jgi:hypothetical protein
VLVEALVLGRNDRVLQRVGDLADRHYGAPLLAELADLHAFGGVNAQRDLRLVLGQRLERRQIRIGERDGERQQQHAGHQKAPRQDQREGEKSKPLQGLIVTGMLCSTLHLEHDTPFALWKID